MVSRDINTSQPPRQVKFENGIEFLDQVKLQFCKQPDVYKQFLSIMKEYKAKLYVFIALINTHIMLIVSRSIDIPKVMARVIELFKGHEHLILGFNSFLPSGYTIEVQDGATPQLITALIPPSYPSLPINPQPSYSPGRKVPEFDHSRYPPSQVFIYVYIYILLDKKYKLREEDQKSVPAYSLQILPRHITRLPQGAVHR